MKNPIFKINNLSYSKKNMNLMSIKNFEMHRGACYIINGNMASGKTLLLNILSKTIKKYNGEIFYEDKDMKSYSKTEISKEIFYVKQSFSAPYFKTVSSYLSDCSKNNSLAKNKSKNIENLVSKMDFKYLLDLKMRNLTPSQLRWVNIAAGIASFPKILLIDELEMHLSLSNIKIISKLLYRKSNYEGVTVVATTQNKDFFNTLSSININLNNGRITSVRSNTKKKKYKK